jgi:hypothetical protein
MADMFGDMGYWELFEHGRRIILPVTGHLIRVGHEGIEADLKLVSDAWARTQQMQMIYTTMFTAPAELRRELGREPTAAELLERIAQAAEKGPAFGPIQDGEGAASP